MRRILAALFCFLVVGAMFFFCALAGGIKWGSEAAFFISMMGCLSSSASALFTLSGAWK